MNKEELLEIINNMQFKIKKQLERIENEKSNNISS